FYPPMRQEPAPPFSAPSVPPKPFLAGFFPPEATDMPSVPQWRPRENPERLLTGPPLRHQVQDTGGYQMDVGNPGSQQGFSNLPPPPDDVGIAGALLSWFQPSSAQECPGRPAPPMRTIAPPRAPGAAGTCPELPGRPAPPPPPRTLGPGQRRPAQGTLAPSGQQLLPSGTLGRPAPGTLAPGPPARTIAPGGGRQLCGPPASAGALLGR
ncbi:unnamed protein product, partial [Polarella glacialis]